MDESSLEPWDPMIVAPRLAAVREAIGINKAEMADMLRLDRSSYTKVEKGQKPLLPREAFRLWTLYGVDMNFIYGGHVGGLPAELSKKVMNHLKGPNK
jgi:transcriptional regulator with XRE-family HTH domain